MTFRVRVDVANPGQFFAACGLFELASRLSADATGRFEGPELVVDGAGALDEVLTAFTMTSLGEAPTDRGAKADADAAPDGDGEDDEDVDRSAPLLLGEPFRLRLDWWLDRVAGGRDLKVWAGTMNNVRISRALFAAMQSADYRSARLFDVGQVVNDPASPTKKVEPFCFDARRAPNAHSRDVGFSPDALGLTTTAFPAVELLCLVGLQRFRPAQPDPDKRRIFVYRTWATPLPVELASVVVAGAVPFGGCRSYRFENWFRTGQKKHKAFRAAVLVAEGE